MSVLLKLSSAIDWINEHIGKLIMWLVLGSVLISAGNAIVRKIFDAYLLGKMPEGADLLDLPTLAKAQTTGPASAGTTGAAARPTRWGARYAAPAGFARANTGWRRDGRAHR